MPWWKAVYLFQMGIVMTLAGLAMTAIGLLISYVVFKAILTT